MISVVVCTYNRSSTLRRMLESFYQQDFSGTDHELIVVDNNSSDDTRSTAHEYDHQPGFRYLHEAEQGLSVARNRGIQEARGGVVAFLDDDVLLDSTWLQNLTRCYRETSATVVGGRAILLLEGVEPEWLGPFFRTMLSEVDFGPARRDVPEGVGLWGVNLSFKKDVLTRVGGFDQRLGRRGGSLMGGEEMAVIERLVSEGARVVYEPDARVQHIIGAERLQWDYFARLARANGLSREAREGYRGSAWQCIRLARSTSSLASLWISARLLSIKGASPYDTRMLAWKALAAQSYMLKRFQRLRNQSAHVATAAANNG